jgi:sucrose-6-phosphate hydrolase SacC (GH32 family)
MVGVEIFKSETEKTVIGYDRIKSQLFIDRTQSGNIDFHKNFSSVEFAPIVLRNNKLSLEIVADQSIVEVFADVGSVVISDQVFPESEDNGMQLVIKNGKARAREIEIFREIKYFKIQSKRFQGSNLGNSHSDDDFLI